MKITADRTDAMVREIPFTQHGEIRVTLSAGSLQIVGTDGDTVRIRSVDDRPIDDVVRITQNDQELDIRANDETTLRIGPLTIGGRESAELEIQTPRSSRVVARTASADIRAEGLTGDSRWASASGDISLELAGGAVRFETMSGDVTLEATHIVAVDGRSVSGDVAIRAPGFQELRSGTTSGDLTVEGVLEAGPHAVETISGDTRLITPSGIRVETTTVTGDIHVKGADRVDEAPGVFRVGDGSASVRWRSMSGALTIVADRLPARPPAPLPPAPFVPLPAPPAPAPEPVVVAEAQAAPNLVRMPPTPSAGRDLTGAIEQRAAVRRSRTERHEAARLEVLHAVERGELSIDDAAIRLAALDDMTLSGGGAV